MRTLTSSELRFGTGLKPEAVSCFLMTETKRRNENKNKIKPICRTGQMEGFVLYPKYFTYPDILFLYTA